MSIYPKPKECDYDTLIFNTSHTLKIKGSYITFYNDATGGHTRYFPSKAIAVEVRNYFGDVLVESNSASSAREARQNYPKWRWRNMFICKKDGKYQLKEVEHSLMPCKTNMARHEELQWVSKGKKEIVVKREAATYSISLEMDNIGSDDYSHTKKFMIDTAESMGYKLSGKTLAKKVREERIVDTVVYSSIFIPDQFKDKPLKVMSRGCKKRYVSQCKHNLEDRDFMIEFEKANKMPLSQAKRYIKLTFSYLSNKEIKQYLNVVRLNQGK